MINISRLKDLWFCTRRDISTKYVNVNDSYNDGALIYECSPYLLIERRCRGCILFSQKIGIANVVVHNIYGNPNSCKFHLQVALIEHAELEKKYFL